MRFEYETFTFGGVNSADFGVYDAGSSVWNGAERVVERVKVPGRNGELTISDGSYQNITLEIRAYIKAGMREFLPMLREYLLSVPGYAELEETTHPDEYRMAMFVGPFEPEEYDRTGAYIPLTFDCMPQRWLKSGEQTWTYTSAGVLRNPTRYKAKPLMRLYGTGTLTVGQQALTVSAADGYTDIDCETWNAYKGAENCNGNVTFEKPPELLPGDNNITFTGFSGVEIIPRWWTI